MTKGYFSWEAASPSVSRSTQAPLTSHMSAPNLVGHLATTPAGARVPMQMAKLKQG